MLSAAVVCLALTMYHEARGEGPVGMVAVGQVALNRTADPRWPNDLCKAIKQGGYRSPYNCQFAWYCDGKTDKPIEKEPWDTAVRLASAMMAGYIGSPLLAHATCYYAIWAETPPVWATQKRFIAEIGDHRFYGC